MSKNKLFQPVIKWSGSKRSQAREIINSFPKEIDKYYEPFVGGGSVMRALLESDVKVNEVICSDLNEDLINLWKVIKDNPDKVISEYTWMHILLETRENEARKQEFYDKIRTEFNSDRDPYKFMFLLRTCFNGLVRYNADGKFNTSFHLNRNGIDQYKFNKIVREWSELLNKFDVKFICCSYDEIKPSENDFMYLDPPYNNTKGMYLGSFSRENFFDWLGKQTCGWALSYDGKSGKDDNTYNVPSIYDTHEYIKSGNSSFKRIKESDKGAIVYESLYIKNK